jgi:Methyltransferase domain
MNKTELIQQAINKAYLKESNIDEYAYRVPALSSIRIRNLMNNLGAIADNYLECGTHKGGLFCSTIYKNKNLNVAVAVDSWESDANSEDKAELVFDAFVSMLKPDGLPIVKIKADAFKVDLSLIPAKIDLFLYDAGHSKEDQKNALIYYKDVLADEFIFCCDDWQYGEVKEGTLEGIKEGGYEVVYEKELLNPDGYTEDQHLNDHWWRGYYVALLRKPKTDE